MNVSPGPTATRKALRAAAFHVYSGVHRVAGALGRRRIRFFSYFPDFERKAVAFTDLLRRRGLPVVRHSELSTATRAALRSSSDLWVGFWNAIPAELMPRDYVFLNAEPLAMKKWRENQDWTRSMSGARAVWGYSRSNRPFVEHLGVEFRYVPLGYAPYYEEAYLTHTHDKSLIQDIDVLFFGDVCERRQKVLDEIARRGLKLHVVSRRQPVYGEQLDELLARTKIVLVIYYYDDAAAQTADLARIDHVLANRLFVLHERQPAGAADPDLANNVATCEYGDLPDACVRFVGDAPARAAWAARSHEWFKSEFSLDEFIPYDDLRRWLSRG